MRTTVLGWATVALGAAVVLALAVAVAGTVGLVAVALVGSAAALFAARVRLGNAERSPRDEPMAPSPLEAFQAYRRIEFLVLWGLGRANRGASGVLTRLARALLADRCGVDLDADSAAARRLLGDRAWTLLNRGRASGDAGVWSRADIEFVVDRLESL